MHCPDHTVFPTRVGARGMASQKKRDPSRSAGGSRVRKAPRMAGSKGSSHTNPVPSPHRHPMRSLLTHPDAPAWFLFLFVFAAVVSHVGR